MRVINTATNAPPTTKLPGDIILRAYPTEACVSLLPGAFPNGTDKRGWGEGC